LSAKLYEIPILILENLFMSSLQKVYKFTVRANNYSPLLFIICVQKRLFGVDSSFNSWWHKYRWIFRTWKSLHFSSWKANASHL